MRSSVSVDDLIHTLTEHPDLSRPSRFCPTMLKTATGNPSLRRCNATMRICSACSPDIRGRWRCTRHRPGAVLSAVLPVWRRNGLARTDWDITDQTFALHGLITGIALSLIGPAPVPVAADDPLDVLRASVTALLGPEKPINDRYGRPPRRSSSSPGGPPPCRRSTPLDSLAHNKSGENNQGPDASGLGQAALMQAVVQIGGEPTR